jgi:magnesium transporter
MLRIVYWDAANRTVEMIPETALPASHQALKPEEVMWIDLEQATPEEEARVLKEFLPIHSLSYEDVTRDRRESEGGPHLPKVEEFPDYLFVIVNPLPIQLLVPGPGEQNTQRRFRLNRKSLLQLSAILTSNILVTHHSSPLPCIADCRAYLTRHGEELQRGPDYIFHLILDRIVDEYAPVVERIADRLDRLETRTFSQPTQEVLMRLMRLKRQVSYLRKTLLLEREVLARLIRSEFQLVNTREIAYYRNVYDHLVRYTELIESAREMVSDLMQTHLGAVSNRLNHVMKFLTMISTVVLPMTLIAGVYGMNFENLPEKNWTYGYPFALGLMLLTGAAAVVLFRWKKWI